jgi:ubiquinone/menaquinone biosynthesis C-methylase UbiE
VRRVTDYDAVAAGYDLRYRHYDYRAIGDALSAFLGAGPPGTLSAILEVGCGTGHWLRSMAGRAGRVAGIDPSAEMIARAAGSGAVLVRARAEALPWAGQAFDRLVCLNALHHFNDRDAFFAEARRVLTPGGGLLSVGLDPHADRDTWWVYDYFPETRRIDLARYPAVRTLRGELVRADFSWSESSEVEVFEHVVSAADAFERGLVSRHFSSQLAVLSDEEFDAGVTRIRDGMAEATREGRELMLASELHLFATTGWLR